MSNPPASNIDRLEEYLDDLRHNSERRSYASFDTDTADQIADELEELLQTDYDRPPLVAWFVIETDVDADRPNPIHSFLSGPFASKEKAEKEVERKREAWEKALEEWDGGNPYDHKRWTVTEQHIRDFELEKLERQDQESYEITKRAAGAVGASLLAEDGLGPLAGDSDE